MQLAWAFGFELDLCFLMSEVYLPLCERSERGIRKAAKHGNLLAVRTQQHAGKKGERAT